MAGAVIWCFAVVLVIDGNKTDMVERKIFLNIVAGINGIASKAG